MAGKTCHALPWVEALGNDAVEQEHDVAHLVGYAEIDNLKIIVGVEHVKVLDNLGICDVSLTETGSLVEDG